MTAIPMAPAHTITLGNRVLQLRGLKMRHVRDGILDQMQRVTASMATGVQTLDQAQIEANIAIVKCAVDDQIESGDFDRLLNAMAPMAGVEMITGAVPAILVLSGFTEGASGASGEEQSPVAPTPPGSTAS